MDWTAFAGLLIAGLTTLGGVAAWIVNRFDKAMGTAEKAIEETKAMATSQIEKLKAELVSHQNIDTANHAELHERINRTRDEYLRRDDFDRHVDGFTAAMREFRTEVREDMQAVASRIDAVLVAINKSASK